jgi:hypothetical protein
MFSCLWRRSEYLRPSEVYREAADISPDLKDVTRYRDASIYSII